MSSRAGIVLIVVVALTCASGCNESCPTTPTDVCPPPTLLPDGIVPASSSWRLTDIDDENRSLVIAPSGFDVYMIDLESNRKLFALDLYPMVEGFGVPVQTLSSLFHPDSTDVVISCTIVQLADGNYGSIVLAHNLADASYRRLLPEGTDERGWNSKIDGLFILYEPLKTLTDNWAISSRGYRYDISQNLILDPYQLDPVTGTWMPYAISYTSRIVLGTTEVYDAQANLVSVVVVDSDTLHIKGVESLFIVNGMEQDDLVTFEVTPIEYNSPDKMGWGSELWVVDAAKLKQSRSFIASVVRRFNFRELMCRYSSIGLNAYSKSADLIFATTHGDMEPIQELSRHSLSGSDNELLNVGE